SPSSGAITTVAPVPIKIAGGKRKTIIKLLQVRPSAPQEARITGATTMSPGAHAFMSPGIQATTSTGAPEAVHPMALEPTPITLTPAAQAHLEPTPRSVLRTPTQLVCDLAAAGRKGSTGTFTVPAELDVDGAYQFDVRTLPRREF
ncbi:hypothetical protein HDU93_009573, partial [Gonapodya sp. JEL0774]